jgi:hypothetical protein
MRSCDGAISYLGEETQFQPAVNIRQLTPRFTALPVKVIQVEYVTSASAPRIIFRDLCILS